MRICKDRNQFDPETQTGPASHVDFSLVEFWRDQLNRIKEYAESQARQSQKVVATNGTPVSLLRR